MNEQEGVIKYQLDHQSHEIDFDITELIAWRSLLYKLELINQHSEKYDGLSYGNISVRVGSDSDQFIISASQTGHSERTDKKDYTLVTRYNIRQNSMKSIGTKRPSSEALTHAAIYEANSAIQTVIHVHSPEIWRYTKELELSHIEKHIDYGSVEMAKAVAELCKATPAGTVFTMLGHEDGVVAYGHSFSFSCCLLIETLAKAIQLTHSSQNNGS